MKRARFAGPFEVGFSSALGHPKEQTPLAITLTLETILDDFSIDPKAKVVNFHV